MLPASVTPGDLTDGFGLSGTGFDVVEFEASLTVLPEASLIALIALMGAGLSFLGGGRRVVRRSLRWHKEQQ